MKNIKRTRSLVMLLIFSSGLVGATTKNTRNLDSLGSTDSSFTSTKEILSLENFKETLNSSLRNENQNVEGNTKQSANSIFLDHKNPDYIFLMQRMHISDEQLPAYFKKLSEMKGQLAAMEHLRKVNSQLENFESKRMLSINEAHLHRDLDSISQTFGDKKATEWLSYIDSSENLIDTPL